MESFLPILISIESIVLIIFLYVVLFVIELKILHTIKMWRKYFTPIFYKTTTIERVREEEKENIISCIH